MKITFESSAKKSLAKLPNNYQLKIVKAINTELTKSPYQNPFLKGKGKLRRHKNKLGTYRIIYTIRKENNVHIIDIGHRKDVYQKIARKGIYESVECERL